VKKSRRGVAVERTEEAELVHERSQFVHVGGQAFGFDRDVFDARNGFGGPFASGEQGQAGLAHVPDHLHLGGVGDDQAAFADVSAGCFGDAVRGIALELDDQKRLAGLFVEAHEAAGRLERELASGLVEENTVSVLDGGRVEVGEFHRGLHGFRDGIEEEDNKAGDVRRQGHNPQLGGEDARERAFTARDDLAQIAGSAQVPVKAVARPAFD